MAPLPPAAGRVTALGYSLGREPNMKKYVAIAMFLVFGTGISVGYGIGSSEPYCPSEDSCQVDYSNGHWTITPQVP